MIYKLSWAATTLTVTQHNGPNPGILRFCKTCAHRSTLDVIAEWDFNAGRWLPHRWIPKSPQIPAHCISEIEKILESKP